MIRRPPRSTLFPYPDALPISGREGDAARARPAAGHRGGGLGGRQQAVLGHVGGVGEPGGLAEDRKSTRLNSSHQIISYAVFCLKKKKTTSQTTTTHQSLK